MTRRLASLSLFAALLATACSSSDTTSSGSDAAGSGSGSGAGTNGSGSNGTGPGSGGSGTGGSGGTWEAGGPITKYNATMVPINTTPGEEDTQCITYRLSNKTAVYARRFSTTLKPGTHHMILYKSNETTENKTPTSCGGFSGLLEGDQPIFIAQQLHSELDLPTDVDTGNPVALEIDANQMVRIELHHINTTMGDLVVGGDIELDTVPMETKVTESNIAFWGTQDIHIPPNSAYDTGVKFQYGLPSTHTFALTTHEHHFGTEMRIWYGTGTDAAKGAAIVDSHNWQDPPLVLPDPALNFAKASGGALLSDDGLAYECHWQNTSPNEVDFGESAATNEMCFLWQYYYPSQGFQYCVDGLCQKQPQ